MMIATEGGEWVNEDFARLAEVVRDYDEYLELRWIPPGQRDTDAEKKNPYCIIDTRSNYIVMFASERDTPQTILARLFTADNKHGSVLDRIDAENAAAEILSLKAKMDEEEMKKDFVSWLMQSEQNYIKVNHPITGEKVKFDDQLRRI